tara:strand:+ start:13680 stop:14513 length:834 start_codon:yes stop_codon:yes gene_type:complete
VFTYIDNLDDLSLLNSELEQKPYIGLDTEFRRTTKDNMQLGLLQINDNDEIYLVDTISIRDPEDQCGFLFLDSVTKIFHSCKEDIEAIFSWTGKKMVNLFDTQIAEALLNGHHSIGYQTLVQEKLGIRLDKKETRSNWIRRPLTDSQLNYAVSDVEFLIHLYLEQKEELLKSNKLKWQEQEIEFLITSTISQNNYFGDIPSKLSKEEEHNLLNKFNDVVQYISEKEQINPTLFFSKKNQKEFIRLVLYKNKAFALSSITEWRKNLIKESLDQLIETE